ncbi:NlpC/P60 family protein [Streptomyces sp. WMMC500]|uniref:C40 family peptidase n=1 Tax=Streptomyces sp. WMMC500 TaxID=3015154 RepID=UPI00248C3392|nr:C40 family peptidase [Streptomyces sp. WMMC500]WBB64512.1 NlpC/P60 family protein [Streptomyces sp. WMMC500]
MVATAASAPALGDSSRTTGPTATESTAELPAVNVSTALSTGVEQSADATQTAALRLELRTEAQEAAQDARKAAAKAKKEAEARAAAEERARERAAARAAEREELATASAAPAAESTQAAETPAAAPAASGSVGTVLDFLNAQLGKAYVLGGTGPSSYDCSGLTQAAFRQVGVELPRTAAEQSTVGTPVAVSDVQPGDLVFWGGTGSAYHVAVYVGDGKYLDAANPSKGVVIQEMSYYMPTSAARVL